jgi:hypothetical protein
MSEFEWRRGMKDLSGPVQPGRDLWLGIAERLAAEPVLPAPRRRQWPWAAAIAAGLLAAAGGLASWQMHATLPAARGSAQSASPLDAALPALARTDAELKALRNRDPRLAGAVIEVDAATHELQQSLQQQPDAVFLVGLLNKNYERRMKLARLAQASS